MVWPLSPTKGLFHAFRRTRKGFSLLFYTFDNHEKQTELVSVAWVLKGKKVGAQMIL